jgi:hypothetical protein
MAEESAGELPTEIGGFRIRQFITILYGGDSEMKLMSKDIQLLFFDLQQHNF